MNILLIEVFVVITIGWTATLYWVTRRWLRQKLAWQWWQSQQTQQLHHQAESIRDGLLQQTFAFRRYLESQPAADAAHPGATPPDSRQTEQWLKRFQAFYQSLETLSNQLSPPFIADSLPLALKFLVKDWQTSHPQLTLDFEMPSDWPARSPQQNQLILSIVTALLAILIPSESTAQHLHIKLHQESSQATLTLALESTSEQTRQNVLANSEIQHLKEIFHSLAAGQLEISQEGTTLRSQLSWPEP